MNSMIYIRQLELIPKEPRQFKPPTIDEVLLAASKVGLSPAEANKFWYFYESKNWMVGKTKMTHWTRAVTGWKLRCDERNSHQSVIPPHIQLRSVEHLIETHPSNRNSIRFDPQNTAQQKAEYQTLKAKRDQLHRQIAAL